MKRRFRLLALLAPRVRVTPDPEQARLLEEKQRQLAYRPAEGFHRDIEQGKLPMFLRRQAG